MLFDPAFARDTQPSGTHERREAGHRGRRLTDTGWRHRPGPVRRSQLRPGGDAGGGDARPVAFRQPPHVLRRGDPPLTGLASCPARTESGPAGVAPSDSRLRRRTRRRSEVDPDTPLRAGAAPRVV